MSATINAYPLAWPTGWKRTSAPRLTARFGRARQQRGTGYTPPRTLSLHESIERVLLELQRMSIDRQDVVISTNVPVRIDGLPRGGLSEPGDPGAAVYWEEAGGARRVMAIDIYDRVADNLAAVAATLDALRAIERHGGAAILDRAFTGFTALPAPTGSQWWDVLGIDKRAARAAITEAYRHRRSEHHPDRGGTAAKFNEVEQAYAAAMSAASGGQP